MIRAWEKRYDLVSPSRGKNRYRQYTDEDVRFFRYLKREVDKGFSIGTLAELGREELIKRSNVSSIETIQIEAPTEQLVQELTSAIQHYEQNIFERKLNGALAVIPFEEALQRFLFPLLERVGDLWHEGVISVAQEHYVSNLIKQKVSSAMNQLRVVEQGPVIVVSCPESEMHDIGAQSVAYMCAARGCRTSYLGHRMPIDGLKKYCAGLSPSLMLFSLTLVSSEEEAERLARMLSEQLRSTSHVGVGGKGAVAYESIFEKEKLSVFRSLKDLEIRLLTLTH
ncbi:MAG: MerR family transcriptional regulator [Nitrospirales bacterium]|nr:MAG: MerR family transcriptional regulator [Nitrospirales bacterium]